MALGDRWHYRYTGHYVTPDGHIGVAPMYTTRSAIYLTRQGTAVLAGDPQAAHKLYPADYPIPRRVAERYGLPALEGAEEDAVLPFSDDTEEKALAGPPATKARSGPQTTKRRTDTARQESP